MPIDGEVLQSCLPIVSVIGLTYLLHSTIVIVTGWLIDRLVRTRSAVLCDRLWKTVFVLPFITVPLQFTIGSLTAVDQWTVTLDRSASVKNPVRQRDEISESNVTSEPVPRRTHPDPFPELELLPEGEVELPPLVLGSPNASIPVPQPLPPTVTPDPPATGTYSPTPEPTVPDIDERESVATPVPNPESVPSSFDWRTGLLLGLAAWSVCGLLRFCGQVWCSRRIVRSTTKVSTGWMRERLDVLRQERGVRQQVTLRMGNRLSAPAAAGPWRWSILVPTDLIEHLGELQADALLSHELAHLKRRDIAWLWGLSFLTALLPWQILHRLALARWRNASERRADDWAVASGLRPLDLAETLTRVAEWQVDRRSRRSALLAGVTTDLTARVMRLLEETPPDRWGSGRRTVFVFGVVVGIAVGVVRGSPRLTWAEPKSPRPVATAVEATEPVSGTSAPMPSEPFVPSDPQPLPSEHPPAIEPEPGPALPPEQDRQTREELIEVAADLERALELLQVIEPDPEIRQVAERMQARLQSLRARLAHESAN